MNYYEIIMNMLNEWLILLYISCTFYYASLYLHALSSMHFFIYVLCSWGFRLLGLIDVVVSSPSSKGWGCDSLSSKGISFPWGSSSTSSRREWWMLTQDHGWDSFVRVPLTSTIHNRSCNPYARGLLRALPFLHLCKKKIPIRIHNL